MKTLIFHNPGSLDIRGATTMGLSAKTTDDAIGKFGTGLKYAIASILRWGGAISIETGGEKFTFNTRPINFRGKHHEGVIMHSSNGSTELGYTTHYGSHWEPWQIFRELYSNAKDEGGDVCGASGFLNPVGEHTIITVECSELGECYGERDTIILPSQGMSTDDEVYGTHLIKAPSNYLYYRGVRVRKEKCLFTWNLMEEITLTEDRSITGNWPYLDAMARVIQASSDEQFIGKALRAGEHYLEGEAGYSSWYHTSAAFIAAATWLYKQEGKSKLPQGVWAILVKHAPSLDEPELVELSKVQQAMLDRAVALVARMGLDSSVPIHVVNMQKNTLGEAKNGQVYLSPQVFEQGTKQVVSTLFEECLHLETGLKDCTYEMQTRLFNMIVSLYEEHVFGEAC